MKNLSFNTESDLPYNGAATHYEEVASAVAIDHQDPLHHPRPFSEVAVS